MDFISNWLEDILLANKERITQQKVTNRLSEDGPSDSDDDNDTFEMSQSTTFDPRIAC